MNSARKQRWQQATALVSLSTAGAMTGIAFAHGTLADMTSPTSMPAHLMALKKAAGPTLGGDGELRSAIVSAAQYYLRLAQGKTPAEMEALIWQSASSDGADHGESCAAFASLTLETGAQATGQQSWITGGTSYPWPLHQWADVRVDPNPQSPGIISVMQDAETHQRWHPVGDGYTPQPGDWVMFAGHVEVVTKYSGGVLYTIGGDSMPNLSVNAHEYDDPLGAQGVTGFVNNGELTGSQSPAPARAPTVDASQPSSQTLDGTAEPGQAVMFGVGPAASNPDAGQAGAGAGSGGGSVSKTGRSADGLVVLGSAAIPAAPGISAGGSGTAPGHRYSRTQATTGGTQAPDTPTQQAFIQEVAKGAAEAQRQYGIPAAVTIAQAIDESGWGQSQLAAQDNNLFGIKGTGPAGSVMMPTQEYQNGQWVTVSAPFRVYNSVSESIADHSLLLATASSYKQAMADRQDPDAFAKDLTGVYATDPNYGANLITIMRLYNLYRYGAGTQTGTQVGASSSGSGGLSGVAPLGSGLGGGTGSSNGSGAQGAAGGGTETAVLNYGPALGGSGTGTAVGGLGSGAKGSGVALGGNGSGATLGGTGASAAAGGRALQTVSSLGADIPGAPGPVTAHTNGHHGGGHGAARRTAARTIPGGQGGAAGRATRGGQGTAAPAGASGTRQESEDSGAPGSSGRSSLGRSASGRVSSRARTTGAGAAARTVGPTAGPTVGPTVGWPGGSGAGSAGPDSAGWVSAGPGPAGLGGTRIPGVTASSRGAGTHAGSGAALRAGPRNVRISTRRYVTQIPQAVTAAFITSAKTPLLRSEPLYRDVARNTGVRWQLLAACDWMQCQAQPRVSPVYGEKLGTKNSDGTVYRTKSSALEQCARDLIDLARMVYGIDLTERLYLSIRDLANVFAAFRWGGLLAAHHISSMEFPYSVEGLTAHHLKMRWPDIPDTPKADKAGARFPMAFGAVPIVLGLDYPAVA